MLKKISKFIKGNYKFLIGVIVGLLLSGTGVYAANTIYSKNVTYDNSSSGLSATNVQDALDETYNKCMPTAAEKIINLYEDGSPITTANISMDESNPKVYLNATQGIMLDNNGDYRYYGADPNNYITFNDETWRIIGVFHDVDDGTGKREIRMKIIRNESIGQYSWDSSDSAVHTGYGVNDWSQADLMNELNDLYYNSKSGTCYNGRYNASTTCDFTSTGLDSTARSMIDNAVYYLGPVLERDGPVNWYYDDERTSVEDYETNIYKDLAYYDCDISGNDGACPRASSWTGKVGLIYSSDFGYSVDFSTCPENPTCFQDCLWIGEGCNCSNWLDDMDTFTITPSSYKSADGLPELFGSSVGAFGGNSLGHGVVAAARIPIMPTVYLKSSITITGGSGTSSDPYTLE